MAYKSPTDQHSELEMVPVGEFEKQNVADVEEVTDKNEKVALSEKFINEEGGTYRAFVKDNANNITNLIYSPTGEMYQGFNRLMLHTLNNSQEAQKEVDPLVPIGVTFSIPGIAGIQMYDLFTVDYLPETYKNFAVFQVTTIDHTMDSSGWTTSISGQMRIDMLSLTEAHGKLFKPKVIEIITNTDADFAEKMIEHQETINKEGESDGEEAAPEADNGDVVSEKGAVQKATEEKWQAAKLLTTRETVVKIYTAMKGVGTTEQQIKDAYGHPTESWTLNHDNQEAIKADFWEYSGKGIVNIVQDGTTGTNEDLAWWIYTETSSQTRKDCLKLAGYPPAYKLP